MSPITLAGLEEQLRRLPSEQLSLVADFVSALIGQQDATERAHLLQAAASAMRKDWDRPEEDEAWADL